MGRSRLIFGGGEARMWDVSELERHTNEDIHTVHPQPAFQKTCKKYSRE
jgi:hypothetical protein